MPLRIDAYRWLTCCWLYLSDFDSRKLNKCYCKQYCHQGEHCTKHYLICTEKYESHEDCPDIRCKVEQHDHWDLPAVTIIQAGNDDLKRKGENEDIEPINLSIQEKRQVPQHSKYTQHQHGDQRAVCSFCKMFAQFWQSVSCPAKFFPLTTKEYKQQEQPRTGRNLFPDRRPA
jgi:hypothetical protein